MQNARMTTQWHQDNDSWAKWEYQQRYKYLSKWTYPGAEEHNKQTEKKITVKLLNLKYHETKRMDKNLETYLIHRHQGVN